MVSVAADFCTPATIKVASFCRLRVLEIGDVPMKAPLEVPDVVLLLPIIENTTIEQFKAMVVVKDTVPDVPVGLKVSLATPAKSVLAVLPVKYQRPLVAMTPLTPPTVKLVTLTTAGVATPDVLP